MMKTSSASKKQHLDRNGLVKPSNRIEASQIFSRQGSVLEGWINVIDRFLHQNKEMIKDRSTNGMTSRDIDSILEVNLALKNVKTAMDNAISHKRKDDNL